MAYKEDWENLKIVLKFGGILFGTVLILGSVLLLFMPNGIFERGLIEEMQYRNRMSQKLEKEMQMKDLVERAYEACGEQDFDNAHKCLTKLKLSESPLYVECRDRVIREECAFLIAQGDEQSAKRIAYLMLQCFDQSYTDISSKVKIVESLLGLAKTVDNNYAIEVLSSKEKKEVESVETIKRK